VVFLHLQTVFEGGHRNTPTRGPIEARKFDIEAPVGHDARVDGARLSLFMTLYGTGGTPWTTVIDRRGVVRSNGFSPGNAGSMKKLVKQLLKEEPPPPAPEEPTDR
jgi:hypothetical protein